MYFFLKENTLRSWGNIKMAEIKFNKFGITFLVEFKFVFLKKIYTTGSS